VKCVQGHASKRQVAQGRRVRGSQGRRCVCVCVTHMNVKSCIRMRHAYECVRWYIWASHVVYMSHGACMNESCHMNESWRNQVCVTSMNASCHVCRMSGHVCMIYRILYVQYHSLWCVGFYIWYIEYSITHCDTYNSIYMIYRILYIYSLYIYIT